jgi:hypothetical protein
MLIETINIGTAPNDGTGDTLRDAGEKINQNFQNLADRKGFFDLTATSFKDDGINGWTYTAVNGFQYLTAEATVSLKRIVAGFHPNHDIDLDLINQSSGCDFHLHWTHDTLNPTGNAIITVKARAGKPDQPFATLTSIVFTLTPSNSNRDGNYLAKAALPADWYPYLTVDACWTIHIERNRTANAATDTFANSIYLFAADAHVLGSGTLTTSKDVGAGWVNS